MTQAYLCPSQAPGLSVAQCHGPPHVTDLAARAFGLPGWIRPPVRPSVLPSDLVFLDACQSKSQTHDDVTVPSPLPLSLFPINSGLKIAFRPRRRLRSSELCSLLAHTRTWSPFAHRELCICPRYVSPGRPHSLSLPLSFFSVTSSLISSLTTSFHLLSLLSFSSQ